MNYVLVFDASTRGYANWPFAAAGLPFVAIGIFLVRYRKALAKRLTGRLGLSARWAGRVSAGFSFFYLGFALLWTILVFAATAGEAHSVRSALRDGTAQIVSGRVEGFTPMPYSGHALEHFTVCGVTFSYSDYLVTPGFNQTSSHGGPMREGQWVRISYVGNIIARLEIAKDEPPPNAKCERSGAGG